jgi:hypothetical protein
MEGVHSGIRARTKGHSSTHSSLIDEYNASDKDIDGRLCAQMGVKVSHRPHITLRPLEGYLPHILLA